MTPLLIVVLSLLATAFGPPWRLPLLLSEFGTRNSELLCGPLLVAPESQDLVYPGSSPFKRITSIEHQKADGSPIQSFAYTHDDAGQLTSENQSVPSVTSVVKEFGYDPTGQLLFVNGTDSESFAYDHAGNRESDQQRSYTIGDNNRILSDGVFTYGYDDEGNLVSKTSSNESWTYQYDHRNRLSSATQWEGEAPSEPATLVSFTYDPLDRRIAKSVSRNSELETWNWVYHGEHIWKEEQQTENGQQKTTYYLTGDSIDEWLATQTSGQISWQLPDRLGSIRSTADNDGNVLSQTDFSAFGVPIPRNSELGTRNSLGFTGREFDAETGLTYYRARYMDPVLGRFISEDPIGYAAGDYNVGRYVGNSPLGYVDPTGMISSADYANFQKKMSLVVGQCLKDLGISLATDKLTEIGIYLFLAEGQIYGGSTLDKFDNRKKKHLRKIEKEAKRSVKMIFDPFVRVAKGTSKAQLRDLEEFFIRSIERDFGEIRRGGVFQGPRNGRHERPKLSKNPCDYLL